MEERRDRERTREILREERGREGRSLIGVVERWWRCGGAFRRGLTAVVVAMAKGDQATVERGREELEREER